MSVEIHYYCQHDGCATEIYWDEEFQSWFHIHWARVDYLHEPVPPVTTVL